MKHLFAIVTAVALLAFSGTLPAIAQVTVSPPTSTVNGSGSSAITLRWRVGVTSNTPAMILVQSPSGTLAVGGPSGGALTKSVRHPGTGTIFVTVIERLQIDRTTAKRILDTGSTTYIRQFSGGSGRASIGRAILRGSSGGALAVRNFDLRFDDDSGFRVMDEGAKLAARLVVTTNGRGVLSGVWEVAGPNASRGSGFRPIGRVRQILAGARRSTSQSPNLPTTIPGVYRVRFVPDGGTLRGAIDTPNALTYTVVRKDENAIARIDLLSPNPDNGLSITTRFKWREVAGARSYRLEFHDVGSGGTRNDPLAVVLSENTTAQLRDFTMDRLTGASSLYWRIVALDAQGTAIAASSARRLR